MGSTIIVPDLTITEQGVGPAQDVWPDTAAGSGNVGVGTEFGQVLTTQGPPATPTSLPLTAEWISPTNNPTWTQATWFIDPANSTGLASDLNSGIDAMHPVLTYNGGVVAKWGTTRPTLVQNTSITWMSDAPANASDPVVCLPVISGIGSGNGVVVTLQGVLGAAQTLHTGALAGVVAKNRPAKQLLEADLGFAAPIGSLVQNTTAGKSSYAWVYQNVAGTVFSLTEPMAPTVLPFNAVFTPVDTWANGDTFTVFSPVTSGVFGVPNARIDIEPKGEMRLARFSMERRAARRRQQRAIPVGTRPRTSEMARVVAQAVRPGWTQAAQAVQALSGS